MTHIIGKLALQRSLQSSFKCGNLLHLITKKPDVRFLYSKVTLGLDGFNSQQEKTRNQMVNIADKFRDKMNEYSLEDSKNMIFTEDLKNMIHLAQTDTDIEIVIRMIKKFNSQNKQVRFGNFVFGPVVMRLLYTNSKVDEAVELFKSEELNGFFDQIITYQLLFDMLYEHKRYNEILNLFETVKSRQLESTKYPRNVVVLTLAACYKLNTSESLDFTIKLWKELHSIGHLPMRRATTFAAALALNQGKPDIALEILVSARNQNYTTVRNIKVAAYAELGRTDEVITILKSVLSEDTPGVAVHTFNRDTIERVNKAITRLDQPETTTEFNRILELLEKQGHIVDQSMDEQLCSEIQSPPVLNNRDRSRGRYEQQNRTNNPRQGRSFTYAQRPGLNELV